SVWRLEQRVPALLPMEHEGVWRRIFEAMSDDPDFEYLIIDSTIVRAHQHAAGAKKGGLRSGARSFAQRPEHQHTFGRPRLGMPRTIYAHRRTEGRRAATRFEKTARN